MKKIIIASHGTMASGLKNTLELIGGPQSDVTAMNFYTERQNYDAEIDATLDQLTSEDQLVICTDVAFGSVNQQFMKSVVAAGKSNVIIISGMNLPLLLGIATTPGVLSTTQIHHLIEQASSSLSEMDLAKIGADDEELISKVDEGDEFFD